MNFSSELLNKGNKTPAFSISIEGRDITTVLDNRLMSLTLTDNRGFEADQLDLELDDADGKIVLPRRGAVITLALGWKGQPLFPKLRGRTSVYPTVCRMSPAALILQFLIRNGAQHKHVQSQHHHHASYPP